MGWFKPKMMQEWHLDLENGTIRQTIKDGESMEYEWFKKEMFVPGAVNKIDKDPSGKDLKEPGTKGDAGKSPVTRGCLHYFPRALLEVAKLSQFGANKYSWKGWETVPDGIHRYSDAIGRHELAIQDDFERLDPETNIMEATAVAWNALARLELIKRKQEEDARSCTTSSAVQRECCSGVPAVISYDEACGVVGKPKC